MSSRFWRGLLFEYSNPDIVFKVTGEPLKAKGAAEVAELIERTQALK